MSLQLLAGHQNAFNNTLFKISFFKVGSDYIFGGVPKTLGNCPVNAFAAIDHKLFVIHGNVEQYAIALLGVVHLKEVEHLLCPAEVINF